MRPVLLLQAHEMFGGQVDDAIDAALGIEVFHNFTLLHDDIMDHSPIRRGKPTVHIKWDVNTAILSGDTMMVLAYDYFLRLDTPYLKDVMLVFNQTAREVCEGQQYDMEFEERSDVGVDEYLEMIRLKTAVLVAASLKIGAMMAGASDKDTRNLYLFGEKIGLAFQLMDDYLDTFGDTATFGKKTGNDIRTNKKTFLYTTAFSEASEETLAELKHWFESGDVNPDKKVEAVTALYNKLGIRQKTEHKIEALYSEGLHYLDKIQILDERKEEFFVNNESSKIADFMSGINTKHLTVKKKWNTEKIFFNINSANDFELARRKFDL